MPRIMTMNGDQQSVAAAPLDLRTNNRERGSARPRTSPDCRSRIRDARGTDGSPASPTCTATDALEIRCPRDAPGAGAGVCGKLPAGQSASRLPFRKRKIPVEEPGNGDRFSPVQTDLTARESLSVRLQRSGAESSGSSAAAAAAALTLRPDGANTRGLLPFRYDPYQVYRLAPVPQLSHPLVHHTENLFAGINLATRQDEDGDTALHIAVVQEEFAIVSKLINLLLLARRSLDIYNNLRQTPLHLAVITQQKNMVEALLSAGADPAALDRNGQTSLHLCCEYDQCDILSVVLSHSSSTGLEIRNYEGLSPLHLAVLGGHEALARMLLNAGADINAMDIKSGQSPLMHAVESCNADMINFLIESGCDVNLKSYSGNTALHSACGRGQVDTVRLLLKSGADSGLKNYHNDTPVMVAKNKKIADVLRGRGSNHIRVQDQHCASVSPHGSHFTENGSPSPNHSRGCSPLTAPHNPHHSASHSPKTPSTPLFPFY